VILELTILQGGGRRCPFRLSGYSRDQKGGGRRSPREYRSLRPLPSLENGLQRLANEVGGDPIPPVITRNGAGVALKACSLRDPQQPNAVRRGAGNAE
jgi:hypothetical protein